MYRTLLTIPAWFLLVGCFEGDKNTLEDGPYCEDTPTVVGLDEVTALGFSGADLLLLAEGEHAETLTWAETGATTPVAVGVAYAEGEVRFVDSVAVYPEGDGETPAIGVECFARVEVDVTLTIATEDGALDESFALSLGSQDGLTTTAWYSFDHEELNGSYEFTLMDPSEYDSVQHGLSVSFEEGASRGEITAQAEGCDDDCSGDECTCWASIDTVAYWESEEPE
jgi:hypothetical protein